MKQNMNRFRDPKSRAFDACDARVGVFPKS